MRIKTLEELLHTYTLDKGEIFIEEDSEVFLEEMEYLCGRPLLDLEIREIEENKETFIDEWKITPHMVI